MKPRWLLLGASVLCLLVLFPASALSQQQRAELQATCGSARIDGVRSPGEWDNAGVVTMFPLQITDNMIAELGLEGSEWDASLAQATVTASLYAMNDESHLYLAELLNLDSVVADPLYWSAMSALGFQDEPDALDGDWEATNCGPPLPGEGIYAVTQTREGGAPVSSGLFYPVAQPVTCPPITPIPGVNWAVGPGSLFVESQFDLNASEVDKVGPGDCLLIRKGLIGFLCPQGAVCTEPWNILEAAAVWPQPTAGAPVVGGMLCLDPCEVEFVPEPGSILLLGSGLAGLVGYAGLRWRTRE